MAIKNHGIRNVALMAVAPTGTISLLPEVTSSSEPLFCKSYLRHDEVGDRAYIHPIYKEILESGMKTPDWYVDSTDLKPEDHLETQAAIQKWVDGAVSKTINCPKGFKAEQLSKLLLEYIRDLKGVTIYVDGTREGQILNPLTKKETERYIKEEKIVTDQEAQSCANGSCEL
jgi:ribonucleoside-diphosphate reductase alpha chain